MADQGVRPTIYAGFENLEELCSIALTVAARIDSAADLTSV